MAAATFALGCSDPHGTTSADPAHLHAQRPPFVLVQNGCSFQQLPDGSGTLDLFVAIPLDRTIDGKPLAPGTAAHGGPEVYALECRFGARGLSDPEVPCTGAKLDIGPLVGGRPLVTGLHPLGRAVNMEEFRIEGRDGSVLRLESFVSQRRMAGNVSRTVTMLVDLATGRVSYRSHADFVSQVQEARGEATCTVRGGPPSARR